ncbi:MAG: SapC family protein [Polaromonas sp.]|nr:SapC family protein [Polaromonas sp.]
MTTLLIYQDAVALDRERHRHLKLKAQGHARFAATVHAVPLVAVEFAPASREYPIVFARGATVNEQPGELLCYALTGLHEGQNLFVDAAGQWNARYVPAFIRRYPFVFAHTGADQLSVCIDESYPGFDDSEGEPLFDDAGEPAAALQGALDLLTDYQRQIQLTGAFLKKLDAAGILMQAELRADFADGRNALVQGLLVVDEARLKQLPADTLPEWLASGELGLLYAHLLSLGNLQQLVQQLAQQDITQDNT